jgi:hypothetical protein
MSNGWDQAKGLADKHSGSGSGLFVRLANDRDKVVGVFVGDPYARETHWTGERYEVCTGEGCSICAEGKRPNLRVSMNFYVPAERDLKIIEGGVTWFKDLLKARDKYGLDKWLFEIERHGAAGDPKTSYTILPEEKLTPEQTKEIDALRLHDLPKVVSGGSDNFDSYDKGGSGGGETIDARLASQLVGRLKALPRDAVDTFLAKFGVQRVRDLKASDEKAATAFIASLEGKYAEPRGGGAEEVDPFA